MTLPLFDVPALMQDGKMPKTLRPYQSRGIIEVRAKVLVGVLRILCVAPTAAGKMVIISNIIKSATLPVLFVGHRKEILDQCVNQLATNGITNIGVIRGSDARYNPCASVQIGSIATLARRDKPFLGQKIIIIIDECFPAGTLVDGRPIESIQPGDMVASFDPKSGKIHSRKVLRRFCRSASSLVRLTIGSVSLDCTPNHKIWTRNGFVEAGKCTGLEVMLEVEESKDSVRRVRVGDRETAAPHYHPSFLREVCSREGGGQEKEDRSPMPSLRDSSDVDWLYREAEGGRGERLVFSGTQAEASIVSTINLRRVRQRDRQACAPQEPRATMRAMSAYATRTEGEENNATLRDLRLSYPLAWHERTHDGSARSSLLLGGAQGGAPASSLGQGDGRNEPKVRSGEDAGAQPDARSCHPQEDVGDAPQDRSPAPETGWQRSQDARAAEATARSVGSRVDCGTVGGDEERVRATERDQARSRAPEEHGGRGGGRMESLSAGEARARCQEGRVPTFARVDRVEVLEPGGDGTFGGVCPDGLVYNLEVEGTHTYFANGVAVSNCHRAASDSYTALLSAYEDPIVIGFTATPVRLDGRPLGGDLFQELVQIATYAELLKRPDWLVAPDVFAGSERVDVSNVRRSGADFDEGQLGDVMHVDRLEGDVVSHWLARAHLHPVVTDQGLRVPGKFTEGERRRTSLFAVNVEHSMSLAARFERAGARVAHLDGSTPETEREAIFRDLASGQLEVVTNCLVAVEGLDVPEIKCVIHARPTQSLTVWRQCCGREMRPWNNVTPLLLDHAGNFDRLGCPFEDLVWSLTARPKRHGGQPPMRKCPSCGGYAELSKYVCPHCGADLPRKEQSLAESPKELEQRSTEPEALKWAFFWRQVVTAKSKGFKPGFASAIYRDRYGQWPPRHWSDKIKSDFATDGLWQDLLARRLQRKADRESQERREERALSEAMVHEEPSPEEVALERSIDVMDAPDAQDGADAPFAVDDGPSQGDSPFAEWLEGEGIL